MKPGRWWRPFHRCLRCRRLTRTRPRLCVRCMHVTTLEEARRAGVDDEMHERMLNVVNVDDPKG